MVSQGPMATGRCAAARILSNSREEKEATSFDMFAQDSIVSLAIYVPATTGFFGVQRASFTRLANLVDAVI